MSKFVASVAGVLAAALPGLASAAGIQFLGAALPTDLSQNGSVVVGNLPGSFETFRWTQATGVVPLGRATVPVLGTGAGSPDVSWDGTKISATILSDAGTQAVQGRWVQGDGWQQLGPLPPNSIPSGTSVGSAWGLSGDGSNVVGLFWTTNGRAHATSWTSAGGMIDLGAVTNRNSRASATNYDGSVVVGWDGNAAGFPSRNPTLWINGVKTPLGEGTVDSELTTVNADGTIVGGNWRGPGDPVRQAAIWRLTGSDWVRQDLGVLPGTAPDTPGAIVSDLSADGSIAVGFNRFDNSSFNNTTGFFWSAATGMISANQLITNLGLTLPPDLQILDLTSVSPDGSTIAGIGVDAVGFQSFLINIPEPGGLCLLGLTLPLLSRRRNRA